MGAKESKQVNLDKKIDPEVGDCAGGDILPETNHKRKRIAIIGGGPSGIFAAYGMKRVPNLEITIFEQQNNLGGMWNYDERVGDDASGNTIPNCMYKGLTINAPKECLEIPTFTYQEAFKGVNLPSFPHSGVMLEYLNRFANKEDLYKFAYLNTRVEEVVYNEKDQTFAVTYLDKQFEYRGTEVYDYVIVAVGHFAEKNIPSDMPEGIKSFPGEILHSGDLRDLKHLKDKRVLAIGASYSAESVLTEGYKAGAKKVTSCYRKNPIRVPIRPEQSGGVCDQHGPGIKKIEGRKFTFGDDYEAEFDIVIYCTGYKHAYPFLEEPLRLNCPNAYYLPGLYKGIVYQECNQLFYIGAQNLAYSWPLFLNSSLWLAELLSGNFDLPSLEIMKEHTDEWVDKNNNIKSVIDVLTVQEGHIQDLAKDCGNPKEMDCLHHDTLVAWETSRAENIFTHREICHTSKYTKIKASAPSKPWKEAFTIADNLETEAFKEIVKRPRRRA